jgi:hypothetical protein
MALPISRLDCNARRRPATSWPNALCRRVAVEGATRVRKQVQGADLVAVNDHPKTHRTAHGRGSQDTGRQRRPLTARRQVGVDLYGFAFDRVQTWPVANRAFERVHVGCDVIARCDGGVLAIPAAHQHAGMVATCHHERGCHAHGTINLVEACALIDQARQLIECREGIRREHGTQWVVSHTQRLPPPETLRGQPARIDMPAPTAGAGPARRPGRRCGGPALASQHCGLVPTHRLAEAQTQPLPSLRSLMCPATSNLNR